MQKYVRYSLIVLLTLAAPAWAVEDLTLTTPETKPSVTKWRLDDLHLNRSAGTVSATFLEPTTGETKTCTANASTSPTGAALISTLNTANLTSNSLQKRAITWGQGQPNCLGAGTIAGTPD